MTDAQKVYMKIRLKRNASPHEDVMQVLDAVLAMIKQLDNPRLYNHKITFHGETVVKIEFDRCPLELIAKLPKSYVEGP